MNSSCTKKPNIYQQSQLPLGELSADSFEDFVYQSLVLLEDQKKFRMQSGRQSSGDEGFDCTAKKNKSNYLICIQCKRYNMTLYTTTVVEEIVKVALNGILDDSTPRHHYVITSGTVSQKLRKQLRQDKYTDLKEECKKLLDDKKSQLVLIEKVKKESIDPYTTICAYLDSLQDLIVWSGVDFQNELVVIWSELTNILEKHFSLTVVFKEHPRPDFNVSVYLKNKKNKNKSLIPLQYQQSPLPNKLKLEGRLESNSKIIWSVDDVISYLKHDKNILLSSLGGSGKSSTLSIIEDQLISSFEDIKYAPIRINLRSYSRNTLKQRIDQELHINYGSWKSLPFKFVFLFDALDEMLDHDTQAFIDELNTITQGYNFILTLRSTGLNIETTIPSLDYCISIQPLSYRSAFEIAEKTFGGEELKIFYDEYRNRLSSIGFNFLSLPFVLSMTIEYYRTNKTLPARIEDILDNWVQLKINNDSAKVKDTNNKVNKIPEKHIEHAFSLILYKCRIEKGLFSIPKNDYHEIILECYDELASSKAYISRCLDENEFISMISHYEILVLEADGHYSTPHSIISDYLISKIFAKYWQIHIDTFLVNPLHDIWLYSSNFIKHEDKDKFLSAVLSFNLTLGAKVSAKFGIEHIKKVQEILLENEQSQKVIRRSDAISALGTLGTEACLERLRSTKNYIDEESHWQRQRSLAVHGDKKVLHEILIDNEQHAQCPMTISGGTYDIWFSAPPAIVTDIARSRIEYGLKDKTVPICMSLETLALYGDSYDIDLLTKVIEETKHLKEFYRASTALSIVNCELLITLLEKLINNEHCYSNNAKRVLLTHGIKSNINDELNYLIAQSKKTEVELKEYTYDLYELVDFIGSFVLNETQVEQLIQTYEGLDFSNDFYFYNLFWNIAYKSKLNAFSPLVEFAFTRFQPEEINQAIHYLSCMDELNISEELSKEINDYFYGLEGDVYGIKSNYAKYYFKHGEKEISFQIIHETIEQLLIGIAPETITDKEYIQSFGSLDRVFMFIDKDIIKEISFCDSLVVKFLLINTNNLCDEYENVKMAILSQIDISYIEEYADTIKDETVRLYVADFLLKSHLTHNSLMIIKEFLPNFLSHHMFYSTIQTVCEDEWCDELASLFLSCFLNHTWTQIDAQFFGDYIDFYAHILTKTQLTKFEQKRDKSINRLVDRVYKIWLEHNGVMAK